MDPKLKNTDPSEASTSASSISIDFMCLRPNKYHRLPTNELTSSAREMLIEFLPQILRQPKK